MIHIDLKDTLRKTKAYIERRNTEIIEAKSRMLENIETLENRIKGNFGEEIINAIEILTLCKNNGIWAPMITDVIDVDLLAMHRENGHPISATEEIKDICFVENDVYTNKRYLKNLLPIPLRAYFKDPADIDLLTKNGELTKTDECTKFPYSIYATSVLISVNDKKEIKFAYIGNAINKLHFENLCAFKENCIEFLENFDKSIHEIIH